MKITREDVLHIEKLAKLELSEGEVEKFSGQLSDILTYIEKLNELDTTGVEPTMNVVGKINAFREDVVLESLSVEDALLNAPEVEDNHFAVPRVIE